MLMPMTHNSPTASVKSVANQTKRFDGQGARVTGGAGAWVMPDYLAAEHPELRVYTVDPGDMRTQMQQDAFPGEDISDRPLPEESVPGLLELIEGDLSSGFYRARDLVEVSTR